MKSVCKLIFFPPQPYPAKESTCADDKPHRSIMRCTPKSCFQQHAAKIAFTLIGPQSATPQNIRIIANEDKTPFSVHVAWQALSQSDAKLPKNQPHPPIYCVTVQHAHLHYRHKQPTTAQTTIQVP